MRSSEYDFGQSAPARKAIYRRRTRRRLRIEPLEVRRLLHAGHDHGDDDPVMQPGFLEPIPGDVIPAYGAEPLFALSSIPALNSLPGAAVSVYLDFDGHFEPSWGSYGSVTTPVYDRDGDPTTFSASELQAIEQIWAQVAEDFAPFNLNVTTVEPPSFANGVAVRVAIGGNGSWTGGTYGGIAYVNNFTSSVANTVFVFSENLSNGNPKRVAEASSHEVGHSFGLRHQSLYNASGVKTAEYYAGPGDGTAPIMGNSYNATRGLWWYGTSTEGPNIYQDDMAVIARPHNGFGYRPDDHGNTPETASPLLNVNGQLMAQGVITTTSDIDYFSFETGAGQVTLTVSVPPHNNLDSRLELRTADGTLIASAAPTNSFGATITANLQAGSYRAVAASQGNYGDVGQYTITADVLAPSVAGKVYYDADRNGQWDPGEPGLAGWTLFDDANGNGVWDATPQFTIMADDTPMATPEIGAVRSTIITSGLAGTILDVNVRVTLEHDDVSSLVLALTGPDNATITLMAANQAGGTSMLDTRFDDQAATDIHQATAPYSGTFRPLGSLANLIGKSPNGTWKLLVSDIVQGGSGTLHDFTLEITTSEPEATSTTDAEGNYLFAFSSSGTRRIRQFDQPGFARTSPIGGVHELYVEAGATAYNLDFGNAAPAVAGRWLYYNQSAFDGHSAAINAADDLAIATDKVAYLPGSGLATFASVSSYSRGINGLMVDVAGLAGNVTESDFVFKVGANNAPESWTLAPAPSEILVRPGAGVDGSDRIHLVWPAGAIRNQWLEVTVKGNDMLGGFHTNTGLPESDVFYFGSRVGDSGAGTSNVAITNVNDEIGARSNIGFGVPITNLYDFDRSGAVNVGDEIIARSNTGLLVMLDLSPPAVPLSDWAMDAARLPSTQPVPVSALQLPVWRRSLRTVPEPLRAGTITLPSLHFDVALTNHGRVWAKLLARDSFFAELATEEWWLEKRLRGSA